MSKASTLWLTALLLALLPVIGTADTVTLKSGEKVEGKITSETAAEVVIEERVSAGITDTRTIPMSDIEKVDKDQPDLAVWQVLRNMKPAPNSLPAASYEGVIRRFTTFLSQYPQSTHAGEAKKALAAFEEEKKRVEAGEAKVAGKWLTKEEAEKERYQINSLIAFNYMKEQGARGDFIGALNTFDAIEKSYKGARTYPDAVDLAKQILGALGADVQRRKQRLAFELKEREKGLELASEPQRSQLVAVHQREEAAANAALEAAQRQNLKWPPFIPNSMKSLDAIAARVPNEVQRLAALDVSKMRQSVQLAEKARGELENKELETAEQSLQQATTLWHENELATRLQTELMASRNEMANIDSAPPEPAPVPETTEPPVDDYAITDAPAPVEPEEKTPFLMTPVGAILVVLLVILVIVAMNVFRRIKERANQALE